MGATAPAAGADLELQALSKVFGGTVAVDAVDLVVPGGSFFALLGPSGCGKTTTLRMVAGLEHPTSGAIRIGQRDVTSTRAFQRPVNTVFQSYALFPHLSVLDNVAFGLRRRRQADAGVTAMAALELVELAHTAHRRPGQLSGGQQQRIALARAIVNRPAVLLLDEPLGALDLKLRRAMQVELKRIQTDVGSTFIHVTHDQEEAMTMADTVAVMNAGRIEQLGPPAELYERPRTAFVANFLGQSNLLPGTVAAVSDGIVTVVPDGAAAGARPLRVRADRSAVTSGRILVGVRPEKVHLSPGTGGGNGGDGDGIGGGNGGEAEEVPASANVVGPGVVADVSFSGVSTQYLVDVPGAGRLSVFSQNVSAAVGHRPGDVVRLAWAVPHSFGLPGDSDATAGREVL